MKNIPSCNLNVDHRLKGADLAEECATVCKELITSWSSIVHTGHSIEVRWAFLSLAEESFAFLEAGLQTFFL